MSPVNYREKSVVDNIGPCKHPCSFFHFPEILKLFVLPNPGKSSYVLQKLHV
jgi:hypothetical protein